MSHFIMVLLMEIYRSTLAHTSAKNLAQEGRAPGSCVRCSIFRLASDAGVPEDHGFPSPKAQGSESKAVTFLDQPP